MNEREFWCLVDQSKQEASNPEKQARKLRQLLLSFSPTELKQFHKILLRKVWDAWRWDIWEIARIVKVGCSEDEFLYFRGWLVSRGQEIYKRALNDPDTLAESIKKGTVCEAADFLYAALEAFSKLTGKEMPREEFDLDEKPKGRQKKYANFAKYYPELCKKFNFEPSLFEKC